MIDFKDNEKVLFIPGCLDSGSQHGFCRSLELWNGLVALNQDLKADYVIAHSLGALAALSNWQHHPNFKIILLNPVVSKRGIIKRLYKFNKYEGLPEYLQKNIKPLPLLFSFITIVKLFRISALDIIKKMDTEKLLIFYGENDIYLGDQKLMTTLKERGFGVHKVAGAGHNYSLGFEEKIKEYIHFV